MERPGTLPPCSPVAGSAGSGHERPEHDPFRGRKGTVVPGYVDLQLNGGFGHDFTRDPGTIWEVGRRLPAHGVTAFLPTIITAASSAPLHALEVLAAGPPPGWHGAIPVGIHLEGPMISAARRGTHPQEFLRPPSPQLVRPWLEAGPPLMVTLAPELPGTLATIEVLAEAGVIVAVGHSDADADTTREAFAAGARHVTHLFNAMSGLDHRAPGVAVATLMADDVTFGLVTDGVHVHADMVRLAIRLAGPDRVATVTDAMAALGMGDGDHAIGDVAVRVSGIEVRNHDGALAGSAAGMDHVVRTAAAMVGPSTAITMATATPGMVVGHQPHDGDLVLLDDDMHVVATAVDGTVLHDREQDREHP